MKCSFCGKKIRPGAESCPECGLEVQWSEQEKKTIKWKLPALIASGVVALLMIVGFVFYQLGFLSFGGDKLISLDFKQKVENNLNHKASYAVETQISKKEAKTLIAAVGDKRLDNGTLQFYYAMEVIDFLNKNEDYLTYLNLDLNKPLSEQYVDEDQTITWEQQFLENAINDWYEYAIFAIMAEQDGYTISAETQKAIETFPEELEKLAVSKGFMNAKLLLQNDFGMGYEVEYYIQYLKDRYTAVDYVSHLYNTQKATAEEIEAYFAENEETLLDYGIEMDMGNYAYFRHIYIVPQGGTEDADGVITYTEAEWAACEAEAQEILDKWLAGDATEDSFAQLAIAHSDDTDSRANGGMYTNVREGALTEELDYWLFYVNHQYGDYTMIKSEYGYHIMYYVDMQEAWYAETETLMMSEKLEEMSNEVKKDFPITRDYSKIVLNNLNLF